MTFKGYTDVKLFLSWLEEGNLRWWKGKAGTKKNHPRAIRELILDFDQVMEKDIQTVDVQIGGPGVIVEIDESKFGSIIHTDYWRAYNGIVEWDLDYRHYTVNHSEGFISSEGTHTNTIEGTWNGVKIRCFPRQRTKKNMPWVLLEFIWRRKYAGDLFGGLMKSLRDVEFVRGDRQPSTIDNAKTLGNFI